MGLQRDPGGYEGFQVVTRGYMGLQGVRRGDMRLQGVTGGGGTSCYRGLQGVTSVY